MTPIVRCLEEGVWPEDKNAAWCLQTKIGQYAMKSGVLFKKGYLTLMLRCVGLLQANYVICEIHMESYGMHVGPRAVWGMDILRPLPPAKGGAKLVIVAIDYFTKWIEAKPLVKITDKKVIRFIMDNIICRFRLSRIIVTDNGAQLVNDLFKSWCGRVSKPASERKRPDGSMNCQTSYGRTKLQSNSNGETLFSLTYGSEAVIPAEIGILTYQTLMIREGYNEEEMRLNLDLLQERREAVAVREAKYKTKIVQYYNKKGKLGPKWEGAYRVVEAYENGSYKLQILEGKEGNVSPIRLNFDKEEDGTRIQVVVTGKEVVYNDLKKPFKEAVKTPLTRRLIEFAGP
ncbi:reverse transcriptase domain-containing protein [Tanacetum coccineum]